MLIMNWDTRGFLSHSLWRLGISSTLAGRSIPPPYLARSFRNLRSITFVKKVCGSRRSATHVASTLAMMRLRAPTSTAHMRFWLSVSDFQITSRPHIFWLRSSFWVFWWQGCTLHMIWAKSRTTHTCCYFCRLCQVGWRPKQIRLCCRWVWQSLPRWWAPCWGAGGCYRLALHQLDQSHHWPFGRSQRCPRDCTCLCCEQGRRGGRSSAGAVARGFGGGFPDEI